MCLDPQIIKNPNYRCSDPIIRATKNVEDSEIEVPCGHCKECIHRKQSDLVQRIQIESLNSYIYFFTLTYNQESVPKITLPVTGVTLMRPNYKHITDMFKRIRQGNMFGRPFKYFVTSEYTPNKGRPHYHGLLFLRKFDTDSKYEFLQLERLSFKVVLSEWRENIATTVAKRDSKRYRKGDLIKNTRHPVWRNLCTYVESYRNGKLHRTYDLHYVRPLIDTGTNDVSYYVAKYLFKDSTAVKYRQKCCFDEVLDDYYDDPDREHEDKKLAMRLYRQYFRTGRRSSANVGYRFTDESYCEYRKSHNKRCLRSSPEFRKYVMSYVRQCKKDGRPLCFVDVYTGKEIPLSKYYFDRISPEFQWYHLKLMKMMNQNKEFEDRNVKEQRWNTKASNHQRLLQRVLCSDLFDDDLVLPIY